jgi:predicted Zn-ribbon and HTH transcriptional regulator
MLMVKPSQVAKVQLWGWRCERCGHEWVPRNRKTEDVPTVCPNCKNPYWNKPRRTAKTEEPGDGDAKQ